MIACLRAWTVLKNTCKAINFYSPLAYDLVISQYRIFTNN